MDAPRRVCELVEGAYRQQLWLMFLDDDQRQLPILVPHDVPDSPSAAARRERAGSDELRSGDRAWFALLARSCRDADVRFRGPVLCSDDGFRWVAGEDFLESPR